MLIGSGAQLANLTPETMAAFNQILPPTWSHNNPVDIIGDAKPELYAKSLEIAAKDPNTDGMLVILTPQSMTDPTATAECLKPYAKIPNKPVIASWMGADIVAKGEDILNAAQIPTFKYPDRAAKSFYYMWRYSENLRQLYETPATADDAHGEIDREKATAIITEVRKTGRTILTEFESKKLLAAYGIPTVETHIALTEGDAVKEAARLGFPVVLKLYSETITHKTDVGGVQLNLRTASAVRQAWKAIETSCAKKAGKEHFLGVTVQPMIKLDGYEIIIGSSIDPQFGPVLLFGTGGQLVEVFKDRALGLPPLNAHARAPHDGAHQDLHRAQGRARPQSHEHRRARTTARALQPARRRAAVDFGTGHQSAAGVRRAHLCARRPRGVARSQDAGKQTAPSGHPPISHSIRLELEDEEQGARVHPAHQARGRAAHGQVPRDPVRGKCLQPLFLGAQTLATRRPRAPDPHLFQRLRPRNRAWWPNSKSRRARRRRSSAWAV